MIFEGVITTINADGTAHITPMGFRRFPGQIEVAPFVPSVTLDNLLARPQACMNLLDDAQIIAGCLTGRRDWALVRAEQIACRRLETATAHLELEVLEHSGPQERPRFKLSIVGEYQNRPYEGFNRARAAVLEASILVSRLDFIDPQKLASEMTYLHIALRKTGGEREIVAWHWLLDAIESHPRHRIDLVALRLAKP